MKTIIFYESKTGFTKEYVDMLERRLTNVSVYPIKKISKKLVKDADNIFFGGPLRNNKILGLIKFLKYYNYMENKNIFVFAVGIQPLDDDKRANVIAANGLDLYHIRLYFLQGGMDINKMGTIQRKFLLWSTKLASKTKQFQGQDMNLVLERLKNPISFVSSSNLDRMVEVYHRVNLTKK